MKGVENPAWKTHKTKDCLSKKVNKKRIASTSKDEPLYKKDKAYSKTSLVILKCIKKRLKNI